MRTRSSSSVSSLRSVGVDAVRSEKAITQGAPKSLASRCGVKVHCWFSKKASRSCLAEAFTFCTAAASRLTTPSLLLVKDEEDAIAEVKRGTAINAPKTRANDVLSDSRTAMSCCRVCWQISLSSAVFVGESTNPDNRLQNAHPAAKVDQLDSSLQECFKHKM